MKNARTILFVDDDAVVREATRMLLRASGYDTIIAGSTREAVLRAGERRDIELLISDYHLGGGDTGPALIRAVRDVLGKSLKAVLLTGDTSSAIQDLEQDEDLRVLSKPIDAEKLLAVLDALLRGSG